MGDTRINGMDTEASRWIERIKKAKDYKKKKFEDRFNCQQLAEYYEGMQYDEALSGMDPYVFNLFFATVEARLPGLTFDSPVVTFKPRPVTSDYNPDLAARGANLLSDMTNMVLQDPAGDVASVIEQAIIDSQFRFGVVEVGYSADWVVNPKLNRPVQNMMDYDDDEEPTEEKARKEDDLPSVDSETPENEKIYVKYIPACNFIVGGNDRQELDKSSWCAYEEYYRIEDLRSIPTFSEKLEALEYSTGVSDDFVPDSDYVGKFQSDLIHVWHIFDNRSMQRIILATTCDTILAKIPYSRLPIKDLRFSKRSVSAGFYPMPPAAAWKSPQDEYNGAKEALKQYRKRCVPKWIKSAGAFQDEEELEKLTSDNPYSIANSGVSDASTALFPVPYASLGSEVLNAMNTSRDDFNHVSGSSADLTAAANRETATKSAIIDRRTSVRESRALNKVKKFLAAISLEIAMLQRDHLTQKFWLPRTLDAEPTLQEVQARQQEFAYIDPIASPELKTPFDLLVDIDVTSLSPKAMEEQKNNFLEFMAIINQYPQVSLSPAAIRFVATSLNVRNESLIAEMQKLALVAQAGQAAQAEQMMGALSQRTVAEATPPAQEQINNQMENQVGLPSGN